MSRAHAKLILRLLNLFSFSISIQVTKDQQTWRKEFKGETKSKVVVAPKAPSSTAKKPVKKKKVGLPILEYQERGTKWVIENHDKETAKAASDKGILEVEISDPKQQVYVYNCEEVTIKISTQFTRTFGCAEGPQAAKYALQTRRRRLNSSALTNEVAAECSPPFPPGIVDFVGYYDY